MTSPRNIPSPQGVAHLRVMEQAASYTNGAVCALHDDYGDIFCFGFGQIRFVWLVGTEAAQCVFQTHAQHFHNHDAYGFLHPIGGDYALITSDEPLHLRLRRVVQPAFKHSSLQRIVAAHLARLESLPWRVGDHVDLYQHMRPHILASICGWLLGEASLQRYPQLLGDIRSMMQFANLPFLAQQFKWSLPLSPWRRFVKARASADSAMYSEIARRNHTPTAHDDLLGLLMQATLEDGSPLPPLWLRDQAISLVSAGFDTSSAGLAWLLYHLLEYPEHQQRVRDSLPTVLDWHSLTAHNGMGWLEPCLRESLRLYPPAPAALRHTAKPVHFQGYTIPAGQRVAFSIYATQRSPRYFDQPLRFVPERWQGEPPPPLSYLPFGHGSRYCIGAGLAQLLIYLSAAFLLQRYRFAPCYSYVQDRGITVRPQAFPHRHGAGLPVRILEVRS